MELKGKLVAKYDTVQKTETFKTREFAIETSEENNGKTHLSYAKFQCVQDKTSIIDRLNIGDTVNVFFNVRGSKWEKEGKVNYFTNLDAWRVETTETHKPAEAATAAVAEESELPF